MSDWGQLPSFVKAQCLAVWLGAAALPRLSREVAWITEDRHTYVNPTTGVRYGWCIDFQLSVLWLAGYRQLDLKRSIGVWHPGVGGKMLLDVARASGAVINPSVWMKQGGFAALVYSGTDSPHYAFGWAPNASEPAFVRQMRGHADYLTVDGNGIGGVTTFTKRYREMATRRLDATIDLMRLPSGTAPPLPQLIALAANRGYQQLASGRFPISSALAGKYGSSVNISNPGVDQMTDAY